MFALVSFSRAGQWDLYEDRCAVTGDTGDDKLAAEQGGALAHAQQSDRFGV
jgi:hypothetical protein